MILTLNWRDLSTTLWPSSDSRDEEQVCPSGHVHCFSTHGLEYVSTLLQTDHASH